MSCGLYADLGGFGRWGSDSGESYHGWAQHAGWLRMGEGNRVAGIRSPWSTASAGASRGRWFIMVSDPGHPADRGAPRGSECEGSD